MLEGLRVLLAALEERDNYTSNHAQAVADLSVAVAHRMRLPVENVTDVEQAAFLHDIGKIGIPDPILNKQGPLDGTEWEAMKEHSEIGERIATSIKELAHLAPVIRATHERWDGKGYPDGLSGKQIPLVSRIIFVCDAFHAMISDRPYRQALDVRTALEELQTNAGLQFCPCTVEAFLDVIGRPSGGKADLAGLSHGTFRSAPRLH